MRHRNRISRPPHPDILPIEQPLPLACKVWSEARAGAQRQVIARTWHGDDWRRCRLCPRSQCSASEGFCMVVFSSIEPDESAALRQRETR